MPTRLNKVLDGRVLLAQPTEGFRSGSDAVLLAAACHPPPRGHAVELGCASGAALLSLAWRRPDLRLKGLELAPDLAALAVDNARRNQMAARVGIVVGDVRATPLTPGLADLVLANPPWFDATRHRVSPDPARRLARSGSAALSDWIKTAVALLKPCGEAIFILRAQHLAEAQSALPPGRGMTVRPVLGNPDRPAKRVLVRIAKDVPDLSLPSLRLHRPDGHETPLATALFRHAAPIFWDAPLATPQTGDT